MERLHTSSLYYFISVDLIKLTTYSFEGFRKKKNHRIASLENFSNCTNIHPSVFKLPHNLYLLFPSWFYLKKTLLNIYYYTTNAKLL